MVLRYYEFPGSAQLKVLSFGKLHKKVLSKGCSYQAKLNTNSGNSFKCSNLDNSPKKCSELSAQILLKSNKALSSSCSDLQKF